MLLAVYYSNILKYNHYLIKILTEFSQIISFEPFLPTFLDRAQNLIYFRFHRLPPIVAKITK